MKDVDGKLYRHGDDIRPCFLLFRISDTGGSALANRMKFRLLHLIFLLLVRFGSGFCPGRETKCVPSLGRTHETRNVGLQLFESTSGDNNGLDRRDWLAISFGAVAATVGVTPNLAQAAEDEVLDQVQVSIPQIPMKDFVDPQGLFSIRVPKTFFAIRRSAKGDLPDSKTGQGRRGSSIFTAGDMSKAEIIAVERYVLF